MTRAEAFTRLEQRVTTLNQDITDRQAALQDTALIGAIVLALVFWVGSSVSSLSTQVAKMSANVDQLQTAIASLQQTQGTASQQLADGKATDARQDARMDAADADMTRIKERVRILEGQKPLALPDRTGG